MTGRNDGLIEFVQREIGRRWQWGDTDCVALAARALEAMTSEPHWRQYPVRWGSLRGALRAARGRSFSAYLLGIGAFEVPRRETRWGDFAIADGGRLERVHVVLGTLSLSSSLPLGVVLGFTDDIARHAPVRFLRIR
jgi:hypothetical protein